MATIKRTLSNKIDGKGESQILLRISVSKANQQRIKSGIFISPKRFSNGEFKFPRANQIEKKEIESRAEQLSTLEKYIIKTCESQPIDSITKEWIAEQIDRYEHPDKYKEAKKSFFEVYDEYTESQNLKHGTAKHYDVLKRDLQRYELYIRKTGNNKQYCLDIDTITSDVLEDFESYLRNEHELMTEDSNIKKQVKKSREAKQRSSNTLCGLFKKLRAFLHWCHIHELTDNRPFDKYKIPSERYGTPYYITLEERDHIADFDLSDHPQLAIQRDIFIFQCLIGCRVSDLIKMTQKNIINGGVEYIPRKTKDNHPVVVRVPLNDRAKALVKKYKNEDDNGKLFPFISEVNYNEDIKEIFKLCGVTRMVTKLNALTREEEKCPINEVASSHMARRTFCGNLYKKVKDASLVASLSGHVDGSKSFARYRDIDEDTKKELVKLID